jgi:hypothetical protein
VISNSEKDVRFILGSSKTSLKPSYTPTSPRGRQSTTL